MMLQFMGLFLLSLAVSLDGFGVGVTYGMQKIRMPASAIAVIMVCSGLIILTSMTIGDLLTNFLPTSIMERLGGFILLAIGLFSLFQFIRQKWKRKQSNNGPSDRNALQNLKTVVTTPEHADLDKSGVISVREAFFLGVALALDAFGAGIAASMLGYPPMLTAFLIATMSGLCVLSGVKAGAFLSKFEKMDSLAVLPPLLLIGIGVINII